MNLKIFKIYGVIGNYEPAMQFPITKFACSWVLPLVGYHVK